MPNIVLTRIDERLIHGQVATQWCGVIGANLILVANDDVASNTLHITVIILNYCIQNITYI